MRSFDNEKNLFTYQVIILTENMINLGFYANENELLTMVEPLISLLDGSNDFHSIEDETQFNQKKKQLEEQNMAVGGTAITIKLDKKKRYMQCTENETLI